MRRMMVLLMIALAVSTASASDSTMFNYQGRVMVQGMPYTGAGRMKVAILATTGTSTVASLWSNDGTSLAGSEPADSFSVNAASGVFDVMIGDTALGMQPLPAILFNRNDELKVRVWFNDGLHGFQKLSPDRRLINPRRMGVTDVYSSTTLYVNATTGDDLNSGLSPAAAKKTIQAAVDMVPSRLFNNFTIDVANGVYRESVSISDIHAQSPYRFVILGDAETVPSDSATPAVRLTGTNNDSTHAMIRSKGFCIEECNGVEVKGFSIDYFSGNGILIDGGHVFATNCKCSNLPDWAYGFNLNPSSYGQFVNCWARYVWRGYGASGGVTMDLINCGASDCTSYGAIAQASCMINLYGSCTFSRNPYGLGIWQNSTAWFQDGTHYFNNNEVAIFIQMQSVTRLIGKAVFSGNGTNVVTSDDSHAL